jgi:hypothetical protein
MVIGPFTDKPDLRLHRPHCIHSGAMGNAYDREASVQRERSLRKSAKMDRNIAGPSCGTDLARRRRVGGQVEMEG